VGISWGYYSNQCPIYAIIHSVFTYGGDPVSTWVTKPEVHVEDVAHLVKYAANLIFANDADINARGYAVAA
jgi:hypothetical protein